MREYLKIAYRMLENKFEKEGLSSIEEYDKRFGIHYEVLDWFLDYMELLSEVGDRDMALRAKDFFEKYDK